MLAEGLERRQRHLLARRGPHPRALHRDVPARERHLGCYGAPVVGSPLATALAFGTGDPLGVGAQHLAQDLQPTALDPRGQGLACLGHDAGDERAQQLVDLLRASSLLALPDGLFWCSASHGGSLPLRAVWLLADHSRFGEEPPLLLHAKFNIGWGIASSPVSSVNVWTRITPD